MVMAAGIGVRLSTLLASLLCWRSAIRVAPCAVIILAVASGWAAAAAPVRTMDLSLTPEERQWLDQHPVIRAHNEKEWAPYNFNRNGQPQGYTIDVLDKLAERLGIQVRYVTGPEWSEFIEMLKSGQIDLIGNMVRTPEREKFAIFTEPIITQLPSIISRVDRPLHDMEDLRGKTVAVTKGFWYQEVIEKYYPQITVLPTADTLEALKAVAFGRADAVIDTGPVAQHLMFDNSIINLAISGEASLIGATDRFNRIGVRKDLPLLRSALDKALASLGYEELEAIRKKWLLDPPHPRLQLSTEEQAFVKAHPIIRVGNETDNPPYDFAVGDQAQGYGVDLLNLLAARLGLSVDFVTSPSRTVLEEMQRNGKLDLLHSLYSTAELDRTALFSDPYARVRTVFVTRKGETDVSGFDQLQGKSVAVVGGSLQQAWLATHYPGVSWLTVASLDAVLDAVSRGVADAAVEREGRLRYLIRKKGLLDLKVSGWAKELDQVDGGDFRFIARKDQAALISALNKAFASLTPRELQELQARWFGVAPDGEADAATRKVFLTNEERAYLKEKGAITLCSVADWMPFERIGEKGEHEGIAADMVSLIAERLGTPFRLHPTSGWVESVAAVRARVCDMLPIAVDVPDRRDAMEFSRPYLIQPQVVATQTKELFVTDASEIGKRTVGVIKGSSLAATLRRNFPDMTIVDVSDAKDGLDRVQNGELWGFVSPIAVIGYTLQKYQIVGLKIAGKLDLNADLAMASRNDEPLLGRILQKGLDSITEDERRAIVSKWVSVRFEQGTDYRLVWQVSIAAAVVVGVGSIVVMFILRNNRRLADAHAQLRQAHRDLEQVAITDRLTGLFNRSKLDEVLTIEVALARRYEKPLSVIMADIDDFKAINDRFGHQVGDRVLRNVALVFLETSRQTDVVGRWGGEEFVVICRETMLEDAVRIAERMRERVAAHDVSIGDNHTSSFGVAGYRQGDTEISLLKRADDALYRAKQAGRNRVERERVEA